MDLNLADLTQLFYKILESRPPAEILGEILESICQKIDAQAATIVLWQSNIGVFNIIYNIPFEIALKGTIITPEEGGLDGKMFNEKSGQVTFLSNYTKNMLVLPRLKPAEYSFAIGAPLMSGKDILATVCFYWKDRTEKPTEQEKLYVSEAGKLIHVGIKFAKLYDEGAEYKSQQIHSQNILSLLTQSSPELVISVDLAGKIRLWNQTAERSVGYKAAEIIGLKLPLAEGKNEEVFYDNFLKIRRSGQSVLDLELKLKPKKSKKQAIERLWKISLIPIPNEIGEVDSILILGQDLSEKQELLQKVEDYNLMINQKSQELFHSKANLERVEEELVMVEKQALIAQISDRLSHQINNPLMTVLNGVEILQNDLNEIQLIATNSIAPKDSSQKMLKIVQESFDSLKDASKEGQKIKGILKRLREFSMFTRDQNYRPTSLIEVLNQGLTDYKAKCEQNKIQFTKKIENISLNEGKILGNFNLLTRVISIITDNAITAIIKKKKITSSDFIKVTLEPVINLNQTSLRLSISDSGIGMNQSQLDSLYTPFFSDWAPLEEDELHIGLGMAIVKLIVQNHRGNIEVKSKEQKGTTITIEFPTI